MKKLWWLLEIPTGILFRPVGIFAVAFMILAIFLAMTAPVYYDQYCYYLGRLLSGKQALLLHLMFAILGLSLAVVSILFHAIADMCWNKRHCASN